VLLAAWVARLYLVALTWIVIAIAIWPAYRHFAGRSAAIAKGGGGHGRLVMFDIPDFP
jgi:hypothetical protein